MQIRITPLPLRWMLAAGLALGLGAAHAAGGSTTHEQEAQIKVGMTTQEVQAALGQPVRTVTYRKEPGPTWTYDVATAWSRSVFEIDFDAAGKVASFDERELIIK